MAGGGIGLCEYFVTFDTSGGVFVGIVIHASAFFNVDPSSSRPCGVVGGEVLQGNMLPCTCPHRYP